MTYSIKPIDTRAKLKFLAALIAVFLVLFAGVAFGARHYYQENLKPPGTSESTQVIVVEPGDGAQTIAEKLEQDGLIRASWAFSWYMRSQGLRSEIQTGTYALSPSQSVQEIATLITGGLREISTVTILPEQRIDQIRSDLINAGFLPEEVDTALEPTQYSDHPALKDKPKTANLEGYLYPETFQIDSTTQAKDIVELSLDEMAKRLSPEIRKGIRQQGLSVHEGIILASIIEKEVDEINPADRPRVAQVFLARLDKNMELESNATAGYGAVLDGKEPTDKYRSPYNTYQNTGLTPTPISNVSASSLRAVANPADTDYLYFVSGDRDEEGVSETYFSSTLEEHERLVEQHCSVLCR